MEDFMANMDKVSMCHVTVDSFSTQIVHVSI